MFLTYICNLCYLSDGGASQRGRLERAEEAAD